MEIVAESDSPDRDCPSQRAVTSNWRDLDFFGCSEPVELVASPLVDSRASFDFTGRPIQLRIAGR